MAGFVVPKSKNPLFSGLFDVAFTGQIPKRFMQDLEALARILLIKYHYMGVLLAFAG